VEQHNPNMNRHRDIWNRFCLRHDVCCTWTPLFDVSEKGVVLTKTIGITRSRKILKRSDSMESLVRHECKKLINDWKDKSFLYDGMIYMMAAQDAVGAVPMYIGKAETLGKAKGNLSANIMGIDRDTSKFARWGDNYAYHIGDLSAVVIPGHDERYATNKYHKWAAALFDNYPSEEPILKRPVYFWAKAWLSSETGPWEEFGPTRLTFLEYLLIGLAGAAFGGLVLNQEGKNRE
jgi:hypothetical protein